MTRLLAWLEEWVRLRPGWIVVILVATVLGVRSCIEADRVRRQEAWADSLAAANARAEGALERSRSMRALAESALAAADSYRVVAAQATGRAERERRRAEEIRASFRPLPAVAPDTCQPWVTRVAEQEEVIEALGRSVRDYATALAADSADLRLKQGAVDSLRVANGLLDSTLVSLRQTIAARPRSVERRAISLGGPQLGLGVALFPSLEGGGGVRSQVGVTVSIPIRIRVGRVLGAIF